MQNEHFLVEIQISKLAMSRDEPRPEEESRGLSRYDTTSATIFNCENTSRGGNLTYNVTCYSHRERKDGTPFNQQCPFVVRYYWMPLVNSCRRQW